MCNSKLEKNPPYTFIRRHLVFTRYHVIQQCPLYTFNRSYTVIRNPRVIKYWIFRELDKKVRIWPIVHTLGKTPHTHESWQQDLIECCFQSEIDNQSSTNKTLCCSISKHVHICCSDSPSKVSHLSAINEALQGKIRLLENRIARLQDDVETNNLVNSGNNGMTAIMMSKPKKSRDHSKPVIFFYLTHWD